MEDLPFQGEPGCCFVTSAPTSQDTSGLRRPVERITGSGQFGLVSANQGSVLVMRQDVGVPCAGSSVVQWTQGREFDQRSTGVGDTVQGYNWFHTYLQILTVDDPNDPNTSDVTWRASAHETFTFANSGSFTFAAHDSTFATVSHEHAGDPNDTYRLEFLDGSLMVFHDQAHTPAVERGKLWYIEDVYGNQLLCHHDASGNIDYIMDASGHYIDYSYLDNPNSPNDGRLSSIRVYAEADSGDPNLPDDPNAPLAGVDYTYKETGDGNDSGCGSDGDLIKVVAKAHETDETGTTFSIERTTHYRYWVTDPNDPNQPGHSHELKMIVSPEQYKRAADANGDPLTQTDAQIDDYATYEFEYDSASRCTKMGLVSGGASCCGGGGDGAGTYEFAYETRTNTNRNEWAVRCKAERTVSGSALWTRYLDLNNWGEIIADVTFTVDDSTSAPLWGRAYTRDASTGQVTTYATRAAVADYDVASHAITYDPNGLVSDYTYDAAAKRAQSIRIRKYSESPTSAVYFGYWEYALANADCTYRTLYVQDASYAFPTAVISSPTTNGIKTQYDYAFHQDDDDIDGDSITAEDTDRPMVIKVTQPTVPTAENGPNVAATTLTYVDDEGHARWTKDAEGVVSYQTYDLNSGRGSYSARDVYTGTTESDIRPTGITSPFFQWADWTGPGPEGV